MYWLLAAALLAVAVRRGFSPSPWADAAAPATGGAVGFLELYGAILTVDFGYSVVYAGPVNEAVAPALGRTLTLLAVTAVFVVFLGGILVGVRRVLDTYSSRLAAVPGAVVGAVPPVVLLVTLIVAGLEWNLPYPIAANGTADPVAYAVPALALSLPGVAVLARRDLAEGSVLELRRGLAGGSAYAVSLFGGVVATENFFTIAGVGRLWYRGLINQDVAMLVATTSVGIVALLLVGVVRDLATIGGERRLASSPAGTPATDGGVAGGSGTPLRTAGAPAGAEPLVLVGAGGLALCLLVGLGGAATTGTEITPNAGLQPVARFVAAMASLSLVATLATLVAALVGSSFALVGGTAGEPFRSGVRRVLDVGAVLPALPVLFFWTYAGPGEPGGGSPLLLELSVGIVGGLLLVPFVYRGTTAALARADAAAAVTSGVGDAATYATFVGFVIVEFSALGLHHPAAPSVLAIATGNQPSLLLPAATIAVVAYGLPTLSLLILGAGLRLAGEPA